MPGPPLPEAAADELPEQVVVSAILIVIHAVESHRHRS
jgi:hypothetical protein